MVGANIHAKDVVNVERGGYLALLHASGSNVEVTKGGTYNIDQLVGMVAARQSSLLDKYGMFLMDKLNPEDNSTENLNVTGAVERGNEALINVHMPRTMDVYGDRAVITWEHSNETNVYLVTIKNMYDEVIDEKETSKPSIELNFNEPTLKDQTLIIINVRDRDNRHYRSRDYGIKKLTGNDASRINHELAAIRALANDRDPINKLLIASFFEEHELLIDASTCYNDAIALEPRLDDYKNLYDLFLRRNAILQ